MKPALVFSFILTLLVGCASSDAQFDSVKRKRADQVDVFRNGQKPTRTFREISLLTDDGGLGEEGKIEAKMIKKAKRLGANAIIFQPIVKSGGELKGFSWVETYLYKAAVVVYE